MPVPFLVLLFILRCSLDCASGCSGGEDRLVAVGCDRLRRVQAMASFKHVSASERLLATGQQSARSSRAHKSNMGLSRIAAAQPAAKKLQQLRKREAERKARIRAEVEGWFTKFDENGDGMLQRSELRALLTWLHPSRPPSEDNLDFLIVKATEVRTSSLNLPGRKDGAVAWHDAREAVLTYGDMVKDQAYIDSIFKRYDRDDSGTLEEGELLSLLKAVAPDGCEVDETDVAYVLEQTDKNGDGVIDRDELIPMLAKWTQIAFVKLEKGKAQAQAEAEAARPISKNWQALKSSAVSGGGRLRDIVASAQQQHKKEVATKRWASAGEALVKRTPSQAEGGEAKPSSGAGAHRLLQVVAAARKMREQEANGEASMTNTTDDSGSDASTPADSLPPNVLGRLHSRNDVRAAGVDRDGAWHASDRSFHKEFTRVVTTSGTSRSVTPRGAPAAASPRTPAAGGGSALCTIL